jgi:hypothetical protein
MPKTQKGQIFVKTPGETGRHQWNKRSRLNGAATFWNQDFQQDLHEGSHAGDREAKSRNINQNSENESQDIVKGSAPSETKEETAHGVTARDLGALATLGSSLTPTER